MAGVSARAQAPKDKLNVLFVAVDDLKPLIGCYGDKTVKTPNMDRLAARGMVFDRAYCQQAVCSPSRSSLLTGTRPDTTKVWDLVTHFRDALPDVVTLPQHFQANGWQAEGMGKIYHGGYDDPRSWSVPSWLPRAKAVAPAEAAACDYRWEYACSAADDWYEQQAEGLRFAQAGAKPPTPPQPPRGRPWEALTMPDEQTADGQIALHAVERLRANARQAFFLAVGFLKPHLPFVSPKKYWDLYDRDQFTLADNPDPPEGAPSFAKTTWGELRQYLGMPKTGPLSDDEARSMLHGYHAAVSFMDAQLGVVLDELDRLKLTERTAIVLWGDHGWHLGDHGFWCKHTNYESAAHAPLIMSVPAMKHAGEHTGALTEFVDIYPTLCDVCGIPKPAHLEGWSAAPVLDDPKRPWKRAAFSQYPRGMGPKGPGMGYALATERYRFVEWRPRRQPDDSVCELYDHQTDPKENHNLADRPAQAERVKEFRALIRAGWKGALPG
ncbi:MAG: sulfatase [Armatimonadetes bacterium]|nr:sulfatase [Armatimonadota bacterium]